MLKPIRLTLLTLALGSLALPALASTIVLDPWTTPLPPNPCLTDSHAPVLFTGSYCDGASCPPGTLRVGPCNGGSDFEFNLLPVAPVGQVVRRIYSTGPEVSSEVLPAGERLKFKSSPWANAASWICELDYDWDSGPFDMDAHAVDAIQFEVIGSPSLAQPLYLFVEIGTGFDVMQIRRTITTPGLVSLPLADFTTAPGFDPTQVRNAIIDLESCDPTDNYAGCADGPAIEFSLGPISFHSTLPTPTKQRSWAQVKSIYR